MLEQLETKLGRSLDDLIKEQKTVHDKKKKVQPAKKRPVVKKVSTATTFDADLPRRR